MTDFDAAFEKYFLEQKEMIDAMLTDMANYLAHQSALIFTIRDEIDALTAQLTNLKVRSDINPERN